MNDWIAIIGPPGVGKTKTILEVINKIQEKGRNVLVVVPFRHLKQKYLDFLEQTDKKVFRYSKDDDETGSGYAVVGTLHKHGLRVLIREKGFIRENVIDDDKKKEFFDMLIKTGRLREKWNFKRGVVFSRNHYGNLFFCILNACANYYAKPEEDITWNEFAEYYRKHWEKQLVRMRVNMTERELKIAFSEYKKWKKSHEYFSFTDMIILPVKWDLPNYSEQFDCVVVDEMQNLPLSYKKFIEWLDPKRMIIGGSIEQEVDIFYGGHPKSFIDFINKNVPVIKELTHVFRLPKNIGKRLEENFLEKMIYKWDYKNKITYEKRGGGIYFHYPSILNRKSVPIEILKVVRGLRSGGHTGSILIETEEHELNEQIANVLIREGIPSNLKSISSDVVDLVNILNYVKNLPFKPSFDMIHRISQVTGISYEVVEKLVEAKRIYDIILSSELGEYEKDWVKYMVMNGLTASKQNITGNGVVGIITTTSSPGLTADWVIVAHKTTRRLTNVETKLEYDSIMKSCYTAMSRASRGLFIFEYV